MTRPQVAAQGPAPAPRSGARMATADPGDGFYLFGGADSSGAAAPRIYLTVLRVYFIRMSAYAHSAYPSTPERTFPHTPSLSELPLPAPQGRTMTCTFTTRRPPPGSACPPAGWRRRPAPGTASRSAAAASMSSAGSQVGAALAAPLHSCYL